MTALRVNESSGSLGSLQIADGYGGFTSGSIVAGANVSIQNDGSGNFTISSLNQNLGVSLASRQANIPTITTLAASDGFIVNDEGTGRAALTASIGLPEDGTYSDGLFKDFTPNTRLGIAIDRFNEILALLAPAPAPELDNINIDNAQGTSVNLSFGLLNDLAESSPAYASVDTITGFPECDVNEVYSSESLNGNIRLGAFNTFSDIVGNLNEDVIADGSNYSIGSFGNADQGELRLVVNGYVIHAVDLSSFNSGDTNPSGSGFVLSQKINGQLPNGSQFPNFKHRTGTYRISIDSQRLGWNYAKIVHVYGSSVVQTNYIEWVVDTNLDSLASEDASLTFVGSEVTMLSGVKYFTNGNANYLVRVINAYKNVYDNNAVTFTTSNSGGSGVVFTLPSQPKDAIHPELGEDHNKILHITGSSQVSADYMLGSTLQASINVTHPFKIDLIGGGTATSDPILMYSLTNTSTNTRETFVREDYRIIDSQYNLQSDLSNLLYKWSSSVYMTSNNMGYNTGLQFYNQRLYSPTNTLNGGDFRNTQEGVLELNSPNGNPDYSGETGVRTFFRWFKNESGKTQYDIELSISGNGTSIVSANSPLGSNTIKFFVKMPNNGSEGTGWMDIASSYVLGNQNDNDGINAFSVSSPINISAPIYLTLGTTGIRNNDYIGIRIEADISWSGYLDQIDIQFGMGQDIVEVPDMSTISGISGTAAALSFGPSKNLTDYENVNITAGFDIADNNDTYWSSNAGGDLRLGVFDGSQNITGNINNHVSANMPNYLSKAFSDANSGTLNLVVNGTAIHTVDLSIFSNGSTVNNNGSGFNLSSWETAKYSNNVPYYLEAYRTGTYTISNSDPTLRNGWNYALIQHTGAWGTRITNYIEWVVDSESQNNNITDNNSTNFIQFGDDNIYHSSGIKFFTNPTGSINSRIDNIYKNVYSTSNSAVSLLSLSGLSAVSIEQNGNGLTSTLTKAGSATKLQTLANISGAESQTLHVTGSVRYTSGKSLTSNFDGITGSSLKTVRAKMRFLHPIKNDFDTPLKTISNFLVYNPTENSNASTVESFTGEGYRIKKLDYDLQNDIVLDWNSSQSINDISNQEYSNGLIVYDGLLMSPIKAGNGGDFRNTYDQGIFEGPNNNVNYSPLNIASREYYRPFLNNTTDDAPNLTLTVSGDAKLVGKSGNEFESLDANKNINIEIKVPGKTGWLDLGRPTEGGFSDGDGCYTGNLIQDIIASGRTITLSLNSKTVSGTTVGAEYFVLRITADKDWTGYISNIQVVWSS